MNYLLNFYRALANRNGSSAFFYIFEHVGSISASDIFSEPLHSIYFGMIMRALGFHFTKGLGTAHFDDIFYLFE